MAKSRSCPECGDTVTNVRNKFCSKSCAASFNTRGRKRDATTKMKISRALSERWLRASAKKRADWIGPLKPRPRKYYGCMVCGKTMFGGNKTCSARCRTLFCREHNSKLEGTGNGRCGYYRGIYCGSTYELAFAMWAKDKNLPIARSTRRIKYWLGGIEKTYTPDFEIKRTTFEIKGLERAGTAEKISAAKRVCRHFRIIDRHKIRFYMDYCKEKLGLNPETDYRLIYGQRPAIEIRCDQCDTIFYRDSHRKKGAHTYCSRRCSGLAVAVKRKSWRPLPDLNRRLSA